MLPRLCTLCKTKEKTPRNSGPFPDPDLLARFLFLLSSSELVIVYLFIQFSYRIGIEHIFALVVTHHHNANDYYHF